MFKYIYILDYNCRSLFEIELEPKDAESLEEDTDYDIIDDILRQYGIREKDCNYMISDIKLNIETIEKIKKC